MGASPEVVLLRPSVLWGNFFTVTNESQPAASQAPANGIVFAKSVFFILFPLLSIFNQQEK
jgi:hypothetical protein